MNREIGQSNASAFYPAITDAELSSEDELMVNYRRTMGRYRIMWIVTVGVALAWGFDYVRRS